MRNDVAVSYFTAVIASDGVAWRARDVDVEDAASLDDLADTLRSVGRGNQPVLAVIEHEDEWFALVRVDGDDEPRVFVSDLPAASRGAFAELLAPAAEVDGPGAAMVSALDEPEEVVDDPTDVALDDDAAAEPDVAAAGLDEEDVDLGDLEVEEPEPLPAWAGNVDVLADFGVRPDVIIELCEEHADDPATVLAELGEHAGFAELLEALR